MSAANNAGAAGAVQAGGTRTRLWAWVRGGGGWVVLLTAAAFAVRVWRLDAPPSPVYDENTVLHQAGSYLRGWPYMLSLQPPLAKLMVAASVLLFGDNPWAWRLPNVCIGAAMIPLVYAIAKKALDSRPAALFAAAIVSLDGLFLVCSRTGMINTGYLAIMAVVFLLLFTLAESADPIARRRLIAAIGIALGLSLGAKTGVSEVIVLLATGFIVFDIIRFENHLAASARAPLRAIIGALILAGGLAAIAYVAVFIPYFYHGWWTGLSDAIGYERWMLRGNVRLPDMSPNSSPFWSWPLMLRPFPYFHRADADSIQTVWCGGNPVVWWEIIPAVLLMAARAVRQRASGPLFLTIAYFAFFLMWAPIKRYLLIYDYLPALFIGAIAIGDSLGRCWTGAASKWEYPLLLIPPAAALYFGVPHREGAAISAAVAIIYLVSAWRGGRSEGRFVCAVIVGGAAIAFVYFYPLWTGAIMTHPAHDARMWFQGPGIANWQ
ncbi:MAG: phospholipid carrier-dependent glycosyltransferase [Candidatus Binataceae bacterium]